MKKVEIVMSTYNGSKYLRQQIDSILNQTYPVHLTIRDDGSVDETRDILKEYKKSYPELKIIFGKNLGVSKSFMKALKECEYADYYAFSDQDDIWPEEKIELAVKALEAADGDKPLLYACNQKLVDENNNPIDTTINSHKKNPSFGNALIENVCAGCTEVMNNELRRLLLLETPLFTPMYDWWIYMMAAYHGEVIYDNACHIYYRQHAGNAVGTKTSKISEWMGRIKRYGKNRGDIYKHIKAFKKYIFLNGDIKYDKLNMINDILKAKNSLKYRLKVVLNKKIYRQRRVDDIIFKIIVMLGSF